MSVAGPLVLEEGAKLTIPDETFVWPLRVAVDGDWIISTGYKSAPWNGFPDGGAEYGAWLHRRQANGSWAVVRRLVQATNVEDIYGPQTIVDMHAGVAAIVTMTAGTFVYERSGEIWNLAPNTIESNGFDVSVDNGTIATTTGYCAWQANVYRKAADGVWRLVRRTDGDPEPSIDCENEYDFDEVDHSGGSLIVLSVSETGQSQRMWDGVLGSAPTVTRLVGPNGERTSRPGAVEGNFAIVGVEQTAYSYLRGASGWQPVAPVQRPDELFNLYQEDVQMRGSLAVRAAQLDPGLGIDNGSVGVFQRNANGVFTYVAKLVTKGSGPKQFGHSAQLSGRRVVARSLPERAAYVFELPSSLAQPATIQDNFEDGNASTWSMLAGSTFSVTTVGGSKVLRQTSTVGDAAAFANDTDWRNQGIEAEIRPRSYASGSGARWFGLVTRYTPGNYYYVTLRNSNEVQIRKMTNGTISVLATASLPVTLNRTYRVRLEAIGTRIRAFVDDKLAAEAFDATHSHGQAGIFMYKTAADYDNVVVSPNQRTVLFRDTFFDGTEPTSISSYEELGTWEWQREASGNGIFVQPSTAGDARAITGITTDDQIVQARMQRTAMSGTQNWMGLAARYRDSRNYYYVTLRNNNVVSLRKLVNGSIVELDSAPLTVTGNTWYRVRLSAIGDQLRVFVNDVLLLEAIDSSHATGRYGPVSYRNATAYDDILAIQP